MPPTFSDLAIMEAYGWTWEQLLDTPHWVVAAIKVKMTAEAEHEERERRKH